MAGDKPTIAEPLIRKRIARLDLFAVDAKRERVQTGIKCRVAVDFDRPPIDYAGGAILEEVVEIVLFLLRGRAQLIGDSRQKDRMFGIVRDDFGWIASLQRLVPALEQRGDFRFARNLAHFRTSIRPT